MCTSRSSISHACIQFSDCCSDGQRAYLWYQSRNEHIVTGVQDVRGCMQALLMSGVLMATAASCTLYAIAAGSVSSVGVSPAAAPGVADLSTSFLHTVQCIHDCATSTSSAQPWPQSVQAGCVAVVVAVMQGATALRVVSHTSPTAAAVTVAADATPTDPSQPPALPATDVTATIATATRSSAVLIMMECGVSLLQCCCPPAMCGPPPTQHHNPTAWWTFDVQPHTWAATCRLKLLDGLRCVCGCGCVGGGIWGEGKVRVVSHE